MRSDINIPWWSSRWFAFIVLSFICMIHAIPRTLGFVPDKIILVVDFLFFFTGAAFILAQIRNVFVLGRKGRVLFFFGVALFSCAEFLRVLVLDPFSSYLLAYGAYLNAFFLIYYVRNYADINKARWFIMRKSYPDYLEYHEDIPFGFVGESALLAVPIKRTRKDTQFFVLSDFDSAFAKSEAIKGNRREVVLERLKEFCTREGIEFVESAVEK